MIEQALETWRINNRINLFLLAKVSEAGLASTLSTRGGRDVAGQFGHLHNVRIGWMKVCAPDLAKTLKPFPAKTHPSRAKLAEALESSGEAVAEMLARALGDQGRLKGFKRGALPALGYLIAHDSHHRGSILLTLKLSGHKVDTATQYGIWEWGKI